VENTAIQEWRNADGGFGPVPGAPSEPEATAMIALAFDDERARGWIARVQQDNGAVEFRVGSVTRDVTALGALALPPGSERERALDHLTGVFGANGTDTAPATDGWPWTDGAHGWTEPTAWGLIALRLRSSADDRIADARAFFIERECLGGGWNYGAPETLGVPIGPYVQTTALALLALGADEPALSARGIGVLERLWRSESDGLLSLATTTCALRFGHSDQGPTAADALGRYPRRAEDTVTAAWVALATGASGPWGPS
jgi:hypothetical protein